MNSLIMDSLAMNMVPTPRPSTATQEQLHAFHKMDREMFSRLVINFIRDPAESLLVMALWLWLEANGYPNLIAYMVALPDSVVNALAEEAVFCLRCLQGSSSNGTTTIRPGAEGTVLTSRLMAKEIPHQIMFIQSRFTTISGVKNYLNNVCARVFTDILQRVLCDTNIPQVTNNNNNSPDQQPLVIPGFPHPVFGSLDIVPGNTNSFLPTGGISIWSWSPSIDMSSDDRTMFLTFSRGFPVSIEEVKEVFNTLLGIDCVENVEMENVDSNEQPLYAKMVLGSVIFVDQILKGNRVSKFRINGKHIWARKYERRDHQD